MKEGLSEPKEAQNQEISVVCEISQPKIGPYENGHRLRNDFAALRCPLRNQGLAAKIALHCEMISQPNTPLWKIFAAAKPPLGTRVPFRSTVALFRSCEMGCEMGPPLRKCPFVAKSALLCENLKNSWHPIFNGINSKFLIKQVICTSNKC